MGVQVAPSKYKILGGDAWALPLQFKEPQDPEADPVVMVPADMSSWTDWLCQWRPSASSTTDVELDVDLTEAATGKVVLRATGEQTRAMKRNGVIEVQASKAGAPKTFVRLFTEWEQDVARVG